MRNIAIAAVALACAAAGVEAQPGDAFSQRVGVERNGGDPRAAAVKNPVEATAASITAGRQVYLKNCRHCHGTKGLGDGPLAPRDIRPANLTDDQWDHGSTDGEIFAVIANGLGPDSQMKGAKPALNDTQIWNIVNYLRAIGSPAR
jgi:mono/diheme cytochrome c family protein